MASSPNPIVRWALLLALLLHLPAHFSVVGGPSGRDLLYEDGPAFALNPAYERRGTEEAGDVVLRAVEEPSAAWGDGGDAVGASRWTPVSSALLALQRVAFGSRAATVAAIVSLVLHLAVVVLAVRLHARLGLPRAAQVVGAALVAAAPAALPAAAWPARQGIVVAAALGLGGVHLVLRGGTMRAAAGGLLAAASAFAHPAAFGLAPAALVLRRAADRNSLRWGTAAAALVPVAVAAVLLLLRLASVAAGLPAADAPLAAARGPGILDGAVGVLQAFVSAILPARMHFADGPWTAGILGHAVALVVVLAVLRQGLGARTVSPAALALASVAALLPLLGIGVVAGGSPFHEGPLYLATPFLAAAAGSAVAWGLARGGHFRPAAAAAGALLVGATIAGTAVRAPAFRTREGLLALGLREMPRSPVVAAWDLDAAVVAAQRDGRVAPDEIPALAARATALASRVTARDSVPLRQDPPAATTIAVSLARFADAVARSGTRPGEAPWDAAAEAAHAACDLTPWRAQPHLVRAAACQGQGALNDAYDAAGRAVALAPDDVDVRATAVRAALGVARVGVAADAALHMRGLEEERVRVDGGKPRPDVLLLYARAMSADGTTRAPDPFGEPGIRFRYEAAIAALEPLAGVAEVRAEARRLLHDVYLHYGDVLASLDRTALARISYARAIEIAGDRGEAAEHRAWLDNRLRAEIVAAEARVAEAERGVGNVADALVAQAIAFARAADFEKAKEVFDKLERDLGMSPVLRYHRAVHVLRDQPDRARVIAELRTVAAEEPTLARASYELGQILEEEGDFDGALRAYDEAVRRAHDAAKTTGAEEWAIDAFRRVEELGRLSLLEGTR